MKHNLTRLIFNHVDTKGQLICYNREEADDAKNKSNFAIFAAVSNPGLVLLSGQDDLVQALHNNNSLDTTTGGSRES